MKPSLYARINYRYARAYEFLDFIGHFPDISLKRFRKVSVSAGDGLVLELGCGTGRCSRLFNGMADLRTVSLDINPRFVAFGRKKGRIKNGVAGTAYRLCFRDGTFDKVVVADAFHHLLDHGRLFGEASRVLKPGGAFVIFDIVGAKEHKAPNRIVNHPCDGPIWLLGNETFLNRVRALGESSGLRLTDFRITKRERTFMGLFGGVDAEAILIKV